MCQIWKKNPFFHISSTIGHIVFLMEPVFEMGLSQCIAEISVFTSSHNWMALGQSHLLALPTSKDHCETKMGKRTMNVALNSSLEGWGE